MTYPCEKLGIQPRDLFPFIPNALVDLFWGGGIDSNMELNISCFDGVEFLHVRQYLSVACQPSNSGETLTILWSPLLLFWPFLFSSNTAVKLVDEDFISSATVWSSFSSAFNIACSASRASCCVLPFKLGLSLLKYSTIDRGLYSVAFDLSSVLKFCKQNSRLAEKLLDFTPLALDESFSPDTNEGQDVRDCNTAFRKQEFPKLVRPFVWMGIPSRSYSGTTCVR